MVDHVNDMAADWRKVVASASEALLKLLTPLPEVPSLEVDELLKIGGRINSNSHVLVRFVLISGLHDVIIIFFLKRG
jgi:hypothetical protein